MTIAKRMRRAKKRTRKGRRDLETREFCLGLLDWMQELAEEVLDEVAGMRVDCECAVNSDFYTREETDDPFLFYSSTNTDHTTDTGRENAPLDAS